VPTSTDNSKELVIASIIALSLAVLIWTAFAPTLSAGFVNYDDNDYVYDNLRIASGFTLSGIKWAFTHFHADNWHPLTTISHMVDCQLYGLQPWGHHLTSVLLHGATVILLFLSLRALTLPIWPSAFIAAVFAIHPLRVESVAWISERKDVLSGVFFMLALLAYARYARSQHRSVGKYLAVVVVFGFGLLCKPTLVTLPFVLLLLDYWPLGRMQSGKGESQTIAWTQVRSLVVEKIPLLLLSAAACVVTILAQRQAFAAAAQLPFQARFANAIVSYVIYIRQTVWPTKLAVLYPYPENNPPVSTVVVALIFLWVVSILFFVRRKQYPFLLVGWLWFLGMLVPMIGLVQVGSQPRADRYTYLPAIGLYVLASFGAVGLTATLRRRKVVLAASGAVVIGTLVMLSRDQTHYWRDSEALWQRAVNVTSNNHIAHNSLGNAFLEKGELDRAIAEYGQALQIKPDVAPAQSNLGNALLRKGEVDQAIVHFKQAIQIDPQYAEAFNDMGSALMKKGQFGAAIDHYGKATQLKPNYADAYNNLAVAYLENGKVDQAISEYKKAAVIKPQSAEIQCNLGNALARAGDWASAAASYRRAIEARPNYAKAHNNLGVALEMVGKRDEAFAEFRKASEIDPNYPEAHCNLGRMLAQLGRRDEAIAQLTEALRLKPNYEEARQRLRELGGSGTD
jgi:tetratricopeptide (TPR) repeat protein